MTDPRLVLVQHPPVFLNKAASVARALDLIDQATGHDPAVIAFPETWLPGYPVWLDHAPGAALWDEAGAQSLFRLVFDNAVCLGDAAMATLQQAANRSGAHIIMGAHERLGGTLYNTQFSFNPGADAPALHRKLTPTYNEKLIWGQGDGSTLPVVATAFGAVGGLICWEHWMPLARAAMHAQGEVLHIAQWPAVGEAHQLASRHYAFEGRCFVAAVGTVLSKGAVLEGFDTLAVDAPAARAMLESIPGDAERLLQAGGSAVIGPDGGYVTEPLYDQAGLIAARLDLDRLTEARLTLDSHGHYARPDVFDLRVDTRPKPGVRFDG
ncbi:MAG: carbon-nitrogen hydrolase family protein [Rhodothalassiaceae bacterium]